MYSLLILFISFFKIGALGFGGGLAMLPIIFSTATELGYVSEEEFGNLVAISQVTPGPLAINAATYVGYISHGLQGATAATLGVAIPSFVMMLVASILLRNFKDNVVVQGIMESIRPITVGLIAAAAFFILKGPIMTMNYVLLTILLGTVILRWHFKMNPIVIVIIAGGVGAILQL
ncbi:MAG: chromate transporter [Peptostreptococcaceae bacterium]|nr:chromate transporter [Peptostreptococcaceae bacterium]MDY5738722.1 chromate transporter [Anaerovoracaceae bacterium]